MKQYNLWIKTTLHCLHYSTGYLRSSKELFNKTKAKRNCSVPLGLYVSVCVWRAQQLIVFVCCTAGGIVLCPALLWSFVPTLLCSFAACLRLALPASHHTHILRTLQLEPATCSLTWRRLLNVNASFVLAYDFTFRRFPMQLHIRPRSAALHDERFVCVAHHAMLRRTQCQAVMVIGQDASCKDRKRQREWNEWVSGNGQSLWLMAR